MRDGLMRKSIGFLRFQVWIKLQWIMARISELLSFLRRKMRPPWRKRLPNWSIESYRNCCHDEKIRKSQFGHYFVQSKWPGPSFIHTQIELKCKIYRISILYSLVPLSNFIKLEPIKNLWACLIKFASPMNDSHQKDFSEISFIL